MTKDHEKDLIGLQATNMGTIVVRLSIVVNLFSSRGIYVAQYLTVADGIYEIEVKIRRDYAKWNAYLEHQCSRWDILYPENDELYENGPADPVPPERAVEQLAAFSAEVQELLEGVRQVQADYARNPGIFDNIPDLSSLGHQP